MGRRKKWSYLSLPGLAVAAGADQWEKDLQEYLVWARQQGLPVGSSALQAYATSQRAAGMDLVAIANRIEAFRSVTDANVTSIIGQHQISRTVATLRRDKANAGGPHRKALVSISVLMGWCVPTPMSQRDLHYQVVWFVLLATGCRPEEHHTVKHKIENPEGLSILFNGRKSSPASGAAYVFFSYQYSCRPPDHVLHYLRTHKDLPKIGSRKNCSSCINSWLSKFHSRYRILSPPDKVTSCCPRVRMDNVLRDLVDEQLLTIHVYENMIGHTVKVSDVSYRR